MSALAAATPLRNCVQYARIGFVNTLAFRLRYYTGIVTYLINVTVYYFIWKALYATDPNFAAGFRFDEMVTYVAVGWVIRSVYFNNIDQNMATDVLEGNIAMAMLKPVSVQSIYVGQALGEAGFRLVMLTAPAAFVVSLMFPLQGPASPKAFGLFLASLGLSIALTGALNFIVGCCAVRLKSILGLLRAKFYVQELLSGLLVPMTMFPAALQTVMAYLPFQHIAYTPLRIYLGKLEGAAALEALGIQALWTIALLAFGARFWHLMARKITIHGG
ncbi:MAG: ABC-2 family transporter protein [Bryobacterales bacterium]